MHASSRSTPPFPPTPMFGPIEQAAASAVAARRRPLRLGAAAALGVAALIAAGPAEAKTAAKGELRPTSVRSAAVAQPGGPLTVRLVATASGRLAKTGGVAVYLSKDGKRSPDDARLLSSVRTPKFAAKGKATLSVPVKLAATQPLGAVRVIACVGESPKGGPKKLAAKACRAAKAPLTVVAKVEEASTPQGLIAADLAAGRLKPEQALAYRVLAVFGDDRLPAKYAGGQAAEGDDGVMRELASAWGTLSPQTKKQVGKYFVPTPLRDATTAELKSGGAKKHAGGKQGAGKSAGGKKAARLQDAADGEPEVDASVCDTEYFKPKSWETVSAAGGKIKIHSRTDRPEDGEAAAAMSAPLTAAYAKYKALLGREPLPDSDVDCYHGPDGATDVYVDRVIGNSAITVPSTQATGNQADCEGYPGFIVTNPTDHSFSMQFILAHELFHVFQMSYSYQGGCKEYAWFDEGSANWAAHTVFPTDDSEHLWDSYLKFPKFDIASEYNSWLLALWMEKTRGAATIRQTLERFESTQDAVHAVDAPMGTWRKSFLDFAKHGWNQAPYASFQEWDRLAARPAEVLESNLFLAGQRQRTAYAEFSIDARHRDYKHYPVTDEKVREITFKNDLAAEPDARIGAILTLRSGQTRWEDWSGRASVKLCRDNASDDVVDLVLVYANSKLVPQFDTGGWISGRPELGLRDSCEDLPWHFKVLSASLKTNLDGKRAAGTMFGCPSKGFATRDQVAFTADAAAQPFDPEKNAITKRTYSDELDGRFQAKAPGATWQHSLTGCAPLYGKQPAFCQTARTEHATGDWTLGFTLEAASRKAASAKLTWYVGPIIGGYFDADDSVCNVGTISQIIKDDALTESTVPMETLAGTKPFTLTHQGSASWSEDGTGKPITLSYSWDYAITLQRVAPDGSPL